MIRNRLVSRTVSTSDEVPATDADTKFAVSLKNVRLMVGMSQAQIADAMKKRGFDFHQSTIGKIERGDRRASIGEAVALADVLRVTLPRLLGGNTDLQSAYAREMAARDVFLDAALKYGRSMMEAAVLGDSIGELAQADKQWLLSDVADLTPAQLTNDVLFMLEAEAMRREVDITTPALKALFDALGDDYERLSHDDETPRG